MNQIDNLIQKLCPDGVAFIKLSNVCKIIRGERITKKNINNDGLYPVISGGQTPMGRYNSYNRKENTITVSSYGAAGYVGFQVEKFWANDVCLCLLPKNELNSKFLYYYLCSLQNYLYSKTTKAIPDHIPTRIISEINIPTPPFEVQREIVRILDSFSELTAEFTAELTAELTLRKKQYEFYRNDLLDMGSRIKDVEYKALGDLLNYEQPTNYIVKNTNYSDTYSTPVLTAGQSFILGYTNETDNVYESTMQKPVIIFDDFTTAIQWVDFCFKVKSSAMKILTPKNNVNLRYVFYAMKCIKYDTVEHSRQWISKYSQIKIPYPPLEEQERIVAILDRFDKLCNDITQGLPAEIEARKKQYEYYRDKLLTFKEKA